MIGSLCGVWVDENGRVFTTVVAAEGGREERSETFRPFGWLNDTPPDVNLVGLTLEQLQGSGPFDRLVHAESLGAFEVFTKAVAKADFSAAGLGKLSTEELARLDG